MEELHREREGAKPDEAQRDLKTYLVRDVRWAASEISEGTRRV